MTDRQLMIEALLHETPLPAPEAARRCGITTEALIRWIRRGKAGGKKLEGYHAGRTWMTSVEALARFLAGSPRLGPAPVAPPACTAAQLKRDMERLDRACAKALA